MNIGLQYRSQLSATPFLLDELDQVIAGIRGAWNVEHNETDGHKDITGYSLTLSKSTTLGRTGAIIAGGGGTFGGDLVAQLGTGAEDAIGVLTTVNGTTFLSSEQSRTGGLLMGGGTSGFFLFTRPKSGAFSGLGNQLSIYNLGDSTTAPAIQIAKSGGSINLIDGGTGSSGLSLGNLVRPLTSVFSKEYAFPAVQVASADANTLDDYEEGTFTPTLQSDGGGAGVYTNQIGVYTKIGNVVKYSCYLTTSGLGTLGVGRLRIAGLPFSANASVYHPAAVGWFAIGTAITWIQAYVDPSQPTTLSLTYTNGVLVTGTIMAVADLAAANFLMFAGEYTV